MPVAFGFLLGSILGSFISAVSDRIIDEKSVLDRSHCLKCQKNIAWYDLIPVASFLLLRGKCRMCGSKIRFQDFGLEIFTGFLAALYFYFNTGVDNHLVLIFHLFIITVLMLVAVIDSRTGLIHDVITYPAVIISGILLALSVLVYDLPLPFITTHLLSGAIPTIFFIFLIVITRGRGMGWGDVKYVLFLGLALGFPKILVGLFLAFLIGALFSIALIIFGKKSFGQTIPFGPFLSLGAYIALVWGDKIFNWYLLRFI